MLPTIWFTDKSLRFASEPTSTEGFCYDTQIEGPITRAKILNFFETTNSVTVLTPSPEVAFAALKQEFCLVDAAGGVVHSLDGQTLMIHRNGRWDLPKGHWEAGESLEECALREVEEETGVRAERIVRKLGTTWHSYQLYGRWELKQTHWYEMQVTDALPPTPQSEEGIVAARWLTPKEVIEALRSTYPTIRSVFEKIK